MTTYDSQWASTKHLLHFSGVHGSAKIVDERHNLWTTAGLAQSNNVPLFGGNTLRCGGVHTQSVNRAENINVGSSDFCTEMWVYPEVNPGNTSPIAWCLAAPAASAVYISVNGTLAPNKFAFYCGSFSTTVPLLTSTSNAALDTWAHIAIVRKNYVWTLYVNGVAEATVTNSTITINAASTLFIGTGSSANQGFMGYLADYRFTQGHWRYDGNFTPPTERLPHGEYYDADYDKVVLHCHFNGENGSTTFVDQKGHTITNVPGGAYTTTIDLTNPKFGGSGLKNSPAVVLDGPYLQLNSTDFILSNQDFTIEVFHILGTGYTTLATSPIFDFINTAGSGSGLCINRHTNTSQISIEVNGVAVVSALNSFNGGFLSVTRLGANLYTHVNGALLNTYNIGSTTLDCGGILRLFGGVGKYNSGGYWDEIRVTKGKARYAALGYSVPTEPFPDFTIQKLSGVVLDQASAPLARTVRSYRSSDGLLVDTTVSDAGTGAFSLRATDVSEHFVLVQDPTKNAMVYDHITPVV